MMKPNHLERGFERLGASVRVRESERIQNTVRIDVHSGVFDVVHRQGVVLKVIDARPKDRHLLLLAEEGREKLKFLCGHDERHWFVAAVPGSGVSTVAEAKRALKPVQVRVAEERVRVPQRKRNRRKTKAFIRQGEWFFVPAPNIRVNQNLILKNEPIRRGAGQPHICEELYRYGGTTVYVTNTHPNGLDQNAFERLYPNGRDANGKIVRHQIMTRDAFVYVRGTVRHPDHKTIRLSGWHRVLMNTESQAPAMRNVAFLD